MPASIASRSARRGDFPGAALKKIKFVGDAVGNTILLYADVRVVRLGQRRGDGRWYLRSALWASAVRARLLQGQAVVSLVYERYLKGFFPKTDEKLKKKTKQKDQVRFASSFSKGRGGNLQVQAS